MSNILFATTIGVNLIRLLLAGIIWFIVFVFTYRSNLPIEEILMGLPLMVVMIGFVALLSSLFGLLSRAGLGWASLGSIPAMIMLFPADLILFLVEKINPNLLGVTNLGLLNPPFLIVKKDLES